MNIRTSLKGKFLTVQLLAVLVFGLALTGCENTTNDAQSKTGNTNNEKAKMTDDDLENSIKAKLDSDAQLKAADIDIDVNADRNEATLSGTVESQALRSRAIELAKSARASLVLTDKIDVKPRELTRAEWTEDKASEERTRAKSAGDTVGSSLDDAWIHTKIVTKLIGNATTPERKINVDVNNNVVTLRGVVDTADQKSEAERVAKDTEGVKRVNNQLKVGAEKGTSPTPRAK